MKIILASTSPRRIEMLGWLGVDFIPVTSLVDEKSIRDNDPQTLTRLLAQAKAESVSQNYPDAIVIGSDAVVAFEGQILEKAIDTADQQRMIEMQMGKEANVFASVYAINMKTGEHALVTHITPYKMATVSIEQVDMYIASEKGADKAGGYGLQDFDNMFLERLDGCYTNALGFPLCDAAEILRNMGVVIEVDVNQVVKEKTGKDC